MGILKYEGEKVHLFVPGVSFKKTKKGSIREASDIVDDLWQIADLVEKNNYAAIVGDTYTTMTEKVLRSIVRKDTGVNKGKKTPRTNIVTRKGREIAHPSKQDYGILASVVKEWFDSIWPSIIAGSHLILCGHERMIIEKDDDDDIIDSFGGLGTAGQLLMRSLPGETNLMIRLILRKGKPRRPPRRILTVIGDKNWKAKDRLGVFPEDGIDITGSKKKDETQAEFQERLLEDSFNLWSDWFEEARSRGISGSIGLYGGPGTGKTTFLSGAIEALYQLEGKPTLFCDFDSVGAVSLAKSLF